MVIMVSIMVISMVIIMIIMVIITVILVRRVRCGEKNKTWREGGSCNIIIINATQKGSSGVLNSRNMVSVARTSYFILLN